MSVLPVDPTADPSSGPAEPDPTAPAPSEPTVLVTVKEVLLSTAAAVGLPPAKSPWWLSGSRAVVTALRWVVFDQRPARPCARHGHSYLDCNVTDRACWRL